MPRGGRAGAALRPAARRAPRALTLQNWGIFHARFPWLVLGRPAHCCVRAGTGGGGGGRRAGGGSGGWQLLLGSEPTPAGWGAGAQTFKGAEWGAAGGAHCRLPSSPCLSPAPASPEPTSPLLQGAYQPAASPRGAVLVGAHDPLGLLPTAPCPLPSPQEYVNILRVAGPRPPASPAALAGLVRGGQARCEQLALCSCPAPRVDVGSLLESPPLLSASLLCPTPSFLGWGEG